MNTVALFLSSFLMIGTSVWVLFTSGMFAYSLAGKDPMGANKDYLSNMVACALPLATSTTVWCIFAYIWWSLQHCIA